MGQDLHGEGTTYMRYSIHYNKLAWERDRDNSILCLDGSFPFTEMISIKNWIRIRQYVYCLSCQRFLSKYRLTKRPWCGLFELSKISSQKYFCQNWRGKELYLKCRGYLNKKKCLSDTVCAKHSRFYVLLYLNQVN